MVTNFRVYLAAILALCSAASVAETLDELTSGVPLQGTDTAYFLRDPGVSNLDRKATLDEIGAYILGGANIHADTANVIDIRNSTNAQSFNVFNTYTDASNYERGFLNWSGNVFQIGTAAAGTGTVRSVYINASGTYVEIFTNSSSRYRFAAGQFIPMADSTSNLGNASNKWLKVFADSMDGSSLLMPDLPTSDPSVAGQLWNNSGVLSVSAGP